MKAPAFDKVAAFYDPLAKLVFGNALAEAPAALLNFVPENSKVAIIGGGTGELLLQLLNQKQVAEVWYIEASEKMLQQAKQRLENHPQYHKVIFCHGTENSLPQQPHFQVIITPFLLDLFPPKPLCQLMHRLHQSLLPGGLWLFTDFKLQPQSPLWQKTLVKSMYLFFGWMSNVKASSLPDFDAHFRQLNLQKIHAQQFYHKLIVSEVWQKPAKPEAVLP